MKDKARVIIEFRGRKYRLTKGFACKSNSNCSLFVKGVCDVDEGRWCRKFPCDDIVSAIDEETGNWFNGGYKEVK